MNIVQMRVKDIKPYSKNAKKHDKAQIDNVAESIRQFGFAQPLAVDKDNVLIIGHCRLLAAKQLKIKEVPVVRMDELTEEQVMKLRLLDNKLNESDWDIELLQAEVDALDFDGFDIDWGFELLEADNQDADDADDELIDDEFEDEPITKLGDIWQLGNHRLICGDSTDKAVISKLLDGKRVDMVLSDPPYGMHLDTDWTGIEGSLGSLGKKHHTTGNKYNKVQGDNDDFKPALIETFFANFNYVNEMFLFGADYFAELLPDKNNGSWLVWDKRKENQADAIGSEFELIWSKQKHKRRMLRHDWFGFLSSQNQADARNRVHPTQKPVSLLIDIIQQWGENANSIADIYGGSGSTLIACEKLNKVCYMCELDAHYCDVIIRRWENLTHKKAVLIDGNKEK